MTYDEALATGADGTPFLNPTATADRDSVLGQMLGDLPLFTDARQGYLALGNRWEDLTVPTCGEVQRMSFWNADCGTVLGAYPSLNVTVTSSNQDGIENPETGSFFMTHTGPSIVVDPKTGIETNGPPAQRCSIREARVLMPRCAGAAICGSGGSCVFGRADANGNPVSPSPPAVIMPN